MVVRWWKESSKREVLKDQRIGHGFVESGKVTSGIDVDHRLEREIRTEVVADHVVREVVLAKETVERVVVHHTNEMRESKATFNVKLGYIY